MFDNLTDDEKKNALNGTNLEVPEVPEVSMRNAAPTTQSWEDVRDARDNDRIFQMQADNDRKYNELLGLSAQAKAAMDTQQQNNCLMLAAMYRSAKENGGMSDRAMSPSISAAMGNGVVGGTILSGKDGGGFAVMGLAKGANGQPTVTPVAQLNTLQLLSAFQKANLGESGLADRQELYDEARKSYTEDQLTQWGIRNPNGVQTYDSTTLTGGTARRLAGNILGEERRGISAFGADGKGGFTNYASNANTGYELASVDSGTRRQPTLQERIASITADGNRAKSEADARSKILMAQMQQDGYDRRNAATVEAAKIAAQSRVDAANARGGSSSGMDARAAQTALNSITKEIDSLNDAILLETDDKKKAALQNRLTELLTDSKTIRDRLMGVDVPGGNAASDAAEAARAELAARRNGGAVQNPAANPAPANATAPTATPTATPSPSAPNSTVTPSPAPTVTPAPTANGANGTNGNPVTQDERMKVAYPFGVGMSGYGAGGAAKKGDVISPLDERINNNTGDVSKTGMSNAKDMTTKAIDFVRDKNIGDVLEEIAANIAAHTGYDGDISTPGSWSDDFKDKVYSVAKKIYGDAGYGKYFDEKFADQAFWKSVKGRASQAGRNIHAGAMAPLKFAANSVIGGINAIRGITDSFSGTPENDGYADIEKFDYSPARNNNGTKTSNNQIVMNAYDDIMQDTENRARMRRYEKDEKDRSINMRARDEFRDTEKRLKAQKDAHKATRDAERKAKDKADAEQKAKARRDYEQKLYASGDTDAIKRYKELRNREYALEKEFEEIYDSIQ